MRRALRKRDDAASGMIGAIILLAILTTALMYTNAVYVPAQAEALAIEGRQDIEAGLADLAARAAAGDTTLGDLPLTSPSATPRLLRGIVLDPPSLRAEALLREDTTLRVSALIAQPTGGVPTADAIRVAEDGRMRLYLVGNATEALPLAAISVEVTGGPGARPRYDLVGGAVILDHGASSEMLTAPALDATATTANSDARTRWSWTLPVIDIDEDAASAAGDTARARLQAAAHARTSGSDAVALTIEMTTPALDAWESHWRSVVGDRGTVVATPTSADTGSLVVTILAPPSAGAGAAVVDYDLWLQRFDASLASR